MLRASSGTQGETVNVKGLVASGEAVGIPHEKELLAFADAAVARDDTRISVARAELERALGKAAVVDAAGVVGNFERMNRIADACGIALGALEFIGSEARQELEIEHFNSAANTRPTRGIRGLIKRIVTKWTVARMGHARKLGR